MSYHYLINITLILLAIYASIHALIYKKDPRAAFGWIAVCLIFPFFGPLLYFIFGINRVHARAQKFTIKSSLNHSDKQNEQMVNISEYDIPASLENLYRVSDKITGLPLIGGNKIESMFSAEYAYSEMLEAINNANNYVCLCVYIFKNDAIGKKFIQALIDAKNRGVNVYVLLDGVGELYSWKKSRHILKKNNIQVQRFLPPKLIPFNLSINLRNHRKLLVIDDEISFIGGMNISNEYIKQSENNKKLSFQDIHFKIIGNISLQLKNVYESDWRFSGGNIHSSIATNDSVEPILCRTIIDGPGEHLDHLSIILLSAINSASVSVTVMTPYFLPNRELIAALITASLRGVNVTIILPEISNLRYVHWATRHMLWELLEHEIKILYQPPPFSHAKLFFIDYEYSLIGSPNIDPRSLRLNYEVGVEVYDKNFAAELNSYVQNILRNCRRVTLDEVDNRPIYVKIRDGVAWLFSPYL